MSDDEAYTPEIADEGLSPLPEAETPLTPLAEKTSREGLWCVRVDVSMTDAHGEPLAGEAKVAALLAAHPVCVYAGSAKEAADLYRETTGHETEPLAVEGVQ